MTDLIDQPQKTDQTFWTAKAFHGYISETHQVEFSYETVVRFLHKQNFALKTPQPWTGKQDETLRQAFIDGLQKLMGNANIDLWYADESGVESDPRP